MSKCFAGGHLRYIEGKWRDDDGHTIDAVEVVRCSQCQHWKKDVAGCTDLDFIGRCELANYFVGATGFCVYGKRREENAVD